jgi:hypothetical protein
VATVEHVLSHRALTVDVLFGVLARRPHETRTRPPGDAYDAVRLVAPERFAELGMSTLARKILRAAGVG